MFLFWIFLSTYFITINSGNLNYTTVVTFGDSLTDTGNGYRLSFYTWPPVPPFNINGSYSDGLMWNQILTQEYLNGATLHDFAYGCATTDSDLVQATMGYNPNIKENYSFRSNAKPPGVRQQIDTYINLSINQNIDFDRTLYVVWIGINNYFYAPNITPLETVESMMESINILVFFGVRNLLIFNQPPFDRFPPYQSETTNETKLLYLQHNEILANKLNHTYFTLHSRLNIRLFDCYTFMSKIINDYKLYGFENLDKCWDTESSSTVLIQCNDIKKRIFADEFHLTTAMQTLIAKQVYLVLGGSNVSSLGLKLISKTKYVIFIIIFAIFIFK
ncbi:hypothetical protein I4U23_015190 [Adineta vaga]|nr:hypothetical protein I4U23_015190 [Adineta vaga]